MRNLQEAMTQPSFGNPLPISMPVASRRILLKVPDICDKLQHCCNEGI